MKFKARIVDFPDPVGPVTNIKPLSGVTNLLSMTGGKPIS